MRGVEKTTKTELFFVENADFLEKSEKTRNFFGENSGKRLTDPLRRVIITKQMKQNSRSHPAASARSG